MRRTMPTNKKYQGTAMAAAKKVAHKTRVVGLDSQDFSPNLLRVQLQPLYGMVDRQVAHLSANATDNTQQGAGQSVSPTAKSPNGQAFAFRALVDLKAQEVVDGVRHALNPGMQVTAKIHLGTRTIFKYLLSPVMGAFQGAGMSRIADEEIVNLK